MQVARYCAPRPNTGFEVEAIRLRLASRAGLVFGAPARGALRGHVDVADTQLIAGWAQHTDHPEAPVCLDIYADGHLVGQTLANLYREDLRAARLGSGNHAFAFPPPEDISVRHDGIEVRRSSDGAVLAKSIVRLRAA